MCEAPGPAAQQLAYIGCVAHGQQAPRDAAVRSATEAVAEAIRARVPAWHMDTVHGLLYVIGDTDSDPPGRQVVCDALTDRPIISGNANGVRVVITLPHVSDADDRRRVLDILTAADVLPPPDPM